jgi:hypothetical protein
MFRLTEPSSDQIQIIVLVHSVSACTTESHAVYKIILTFKFKIFPISRYIYNVYVYKILYLK